MHECKCTWIAERHHTWGECIRSKGIQYGDIGARERNGSFDANLDNYEWARRQGIQPKSTTARDVKTAVAISERMGVAYRDDVV